MHFRTFLLFLMVAVSSTFTPLESALGQTNSYKQTNLVSDTAGTAANVDAKLINPWGIAYLPGQPFWIADNKSGYSTTYNQLGANAGDFLVPAPSGDANSATPTGIVANVSGTGFLVNGKPAQFIYDSEDGTISAWNGTDSVTIVVDRSKAGAVYTGLALLNLGQAGSFLLAADFHSRKIDVFDASFNEAHLNGDLIDPQIPGTFAPFGIHVLQVNGGPEIFVTYAMQDQSGHKAVQQAGAGYVSLFDQNGGFVRRFASQGNLNAPWGVVISPAGFASFGGKVLVGEFGDGSIGAYDLATGNFIDQVKDANSATISNAFLWDMVFGGGGSSGDPNTLYITAGLANGQHGLFAAITPTTAATSGAAADFSLSVTPSTATVTSGQSSTFMVTVGGMSGFNSAVALACSGEPASATCAFSPTSVTPASGGTATSTLTLSTKVYTPPHGYNRIAFLPPGTITPIRLLFVGLVVIAVLRRGQAGRVQARTVPFAAASILLAALCLLSLDGCGGSYSAMGTPPGTSTMMVTGTSGGISHSANVTLTVH